MVRGIFAFCVVALGAAASAESEEGIEGSGLFVEPGLTYLLAESRVNYPSPYINSSATTRGFGVVLRGGIHVYQRLFVAADARYAMPVFHDNANNLMAGASAWDLAPIVGVQMAEYGLRLYGGYVLAGNLNLQRVNGLELRFEEPNGWRVGAGLKLKQFSVNIEWQNLHYSTTKVESQGLLASNSGARFKNDSDGIVTSVTFPIEFH